MRTPTLAALLSALLATPAAAETFVDIFAGRSMPERTPLTLTADEARVNGEIVPAALRVEIPSLKPTNSTIYGARIGHWFGRTFGVALDLATLNPDVRAQTVQATANLRLEEEVFGTPLTFDAGDARAVDVPRVGVPRTATVAAIAMARLPIGATGDRPQGRLSPYAFAGPVWLVTDSSLDGNLGLRAGGGVRLPLGGAFALFGEYRYTRVNADAVAGRIGGTVRGVRGSTGDIRADIALRHHAAVGGVSLTF